MSIAVVGTAYSKWVDGKIGDISAANSSGDSDIVSKYHSNIRSGSSTNAAVVERDKAITDSFGIDVSNYSILSPMEDEYFEKGLLQTRKRANITPGDTVPVTYLNDEETHAYVVKQDASGTNYMFEFEKTGDDWILIDTTETEGTARQLRTEDVLDSIEVEVDSLEEFLAE